MRSRSLPPDAGGATGAAILGVEERDGSREWSPHRPSSRVALHDAVDTGFSAWRSRHIAPGRNWVVRRPSGTRDYRNDLPKWTYVLPCGHSTAFSRRLAHDPRTGGLDDWAWCAECAEWWPVDDSCAVEVAPTARRLVRHMRDGRVVICRPHSYDESELALLEDVAILKNRIAAEVDRRWRAKAEFDLRGLAYPEPRRSGTIRFPSSEIQEIADLFDADMSRLYRPDEPGGPSLGFRKRPATVSVVRRILLDQGCGDGRHCRERDCGEPVLAKGLCDAHYRAAWRGRPAAPVPTTRPANLPPWPVRQVTLTRSAS